MSAELEEERAFVTGTIVYSVVASAGKNCYVGTGQFENLAVACPFPGGSDVSTRGSMSQWRLLEQHLNEVPCTRLLRSVQLLSRGVLCPPWRELRLV